MSSSADVRSRLVHALRLDLVGPDSDDPTHAAETIPQAPSFWYLSGFLVPHEASVHQRSDETASDDIDEGGRPSPEGDDAAPEAASARKALFPSSMGLSFLVPEETSAVTVSVRWGDYVPLGSDEADAVLDATPQEPGLALSSQPWQRTPKEVTVSIPLDPLRGEYGVPTSGGLKLVTAIRPISNKAHLPAGTKAVSLFLVNARPPVTDGIRDSRFIFQAQLIIRTATSFVPRPDQRDQGIEDDDERLADLQYREDYEYAVGHNVSAEATPDATGGCQEIRTAWVPSAVVEKVVPAPIFGVTLEMEALAAAPDPTVVRDLVGEMVAAYAAWLNAQREKAPKKPGDHAEESRRLLTAASVVKDRIAAGLAALDDPAIFKAFQITNRVIATAIRQRACHGRKDLFPQDVSTPKWHPFQLAFLLMNISGLADPLHPDREIVDLLFFPTGGGKTEAYLGLAAFTMVLRRLRNSGIQSAGVSVLMRYTLRLLTLDQLGRAATLICALEIERQQDPQLLGRWPFEIGLWVGQAATPNKMGEKGETDTNSARARTMAYTNGKTTVAPIPLENCPWCGEPFAKNSFQLLPNTDKPTELRILCVNRARGKDGKPSCSFRGDRSLPILAVDDSLYKRLPAFLIATVDKFASLPWVGETGMLFGRATHYSATEFSGPATDRPNGQALTAPLLPPDLIIQDELHLISGPLGTMVGLYETAVDWLASREIQGVRVRPKIVASTATVRRATDQIRALFDRSIVEIFPPPGPDRRDSFFARTVPVTEKNGRQYVGIAAQGRSLKYVLLRSYLALLGAAQKEWNEAGGVKNNRNPADPYMTLVGYFNSLRELGGSRRIIEDLVRSRLDSYGLRRREGEEVSELFASRTIADLPLELTSRVSTNEVASAKSRLAQTFSDKGAVDVVLATNMISVGLDITRLGLMVVLGQPKTAAEYIQATSRVGRDDERPGLVVTLLNVHRPRDRSHYERFEAWHNTFYRAVEATSVTPFSPRAVDRGLPAVTVALARLGCDKLTAPKGAGNIEKCRSSLDFVVKAISERAEGQHLSHEDSEELRYKLTKLTEELLDNWVSIAQDKPTGLQYQREVGTATRLLFDPLDPDLENQPQKARIFKAQRSMRDVEQIVNLWVKTPDGADVFEDDQV